MRSYISKLVIINNSKVIDLCKIGLLLENCIRCSSPSAAEHYYQ